MEKLAVAPRFSIATSISNAQDHVQTEELAVTPQETMPNLISGFWVVRSIYLAAELGIFELTCLMPTPSMFGINILVSSRPNALTLALSRWEREQESIHSPRPLGEGLGG